MKTEKINFAFVLTFLFGGALVIALGFALGARLPPLTVIIFCTVIMMFILFDEIRSPSPKNNEVKLSRKYSNDPIIHHYLRERTAKPRASWCEVPWEGL